MDLDDRKAKILRAIIQNYQETGEPVGSKIGRASCRERV